MNGSIVVVLSVLAFCVATWMTSRLCRPGSALYLLDHPNERSLHSSPTPRTGGVAILAAACFAGIGAALYIGSDAIRVPHSAVVWLFVSALAVAAVSFMDDRMEISPAWRFAVHVLAAAALVYAGFGLREVEPPGILWTLPGWVLVLVTMVFVVWMTNLYNFMDGMDGFAGGMTVVGFGTFAWFGWLASNELFATLSMVIAAAAAGFLVFNFPPARIFMGDVGSSTLGFIAAGMILWADRDGVFPFWIGLLVFSPFIVDATVTLMRRLMRGERIWEAHKTHFYQRLVQLGWGHRKTVLLEYALMVGCAIGAIASRDASVALQWGIVTAAGAVYAALFAGITWKESLCAR